MGRGRGPRRQRWGNLGPLLCAQGAAAAFAAVGPVRVAGPRLPLRAPRLSLQTSSRRAKRRVPLCCVARGVDLSMRDVSCCE